MEGMGVKLTSVVVRHLLGCPSMFGPIAGISWTHMYSYSVVQTILMEFNPPPATHSPSALLTPPPPTCPPSYMCPL